MFDIDFNRTVHVRKEGESVMFNMIIANIKLMFKDKKHLIGVLFLPIIVTVIMSVLSADMNDSRSISLAFINESGDTYGILLEDMLKSEKIYTVKDLDSRNALEELKNEKIAAIVSIPEGYSEKIIQNGKPVIDLKYNGQAPVTQLNSVLNSFTKNFILENELAEITGKSGIKIESNEKLLAMTTENQKNQNGGMFILSFIITFMMFSMIFIANEIIDFRTWKVLDRSYSTPNSPRKIIGGITIAMYVLILFQTVVMLTLAYVITGNFIVTDIAGGILLFGSFALLVLSLGVFLSRICKNPNLIPAFVNLIIIPTGIISGIFLPAQMMPKFMSNFSFLGPQYWLYNGIEKLNTGLGLPSVIPNVAVILLITLCFFAAGTYKLQKEI